MLRPPTGAVLVVLVHHARKGSAKMRSGKALRGSSEFHAWGDSNLYLRRHGDQLTMSVEHRAAAAITAVSLHLVTNGEPVALETTERYWRSSSTVDRAGGLHACVCACHRRVGV